MYNELIYNQTWTYNQSTSSIWWGAIWVVYDLSYWWFSLDSDIIKFSATNYDNWHNLDRTTYNNPIDNWIWEIAYYFRDKIITLTWKIKTTSKNKLLEEIDRLKSSLFKPWQDLIIKYGETYRKGKASLINPESFTDREHYHITFLPLSLQFSVFDYMEDLKKENKTYISRTTAINDEIFNKWTATAKAEYNIIINSASNVTTITLGNNKDKSIRINYNFSNWDNLVINWKDLTVKINWAEVDYTWQIPKLPNWVTILNVTPNGTYNISLSLNYNNTYL